MVLKYVLYVCVYPLQYSWAFLVAQMVKNPPALQETGVQSLGQVDPLQEGMATHSSILAWRVPWTEEFGRLQSVGLQRVRQDWATKRAFIEHRVPGIVVEAKETSSLALLSHANSQVCSWSKSSRYPFLVALIIIRASHLTKCFAYLNSFNPHSNSMR